MGDRRERGGERAVGGAGVTERGAGGESGDGKRLVKRHLIAETEADLDDVTAAN